MKLFVTGATGFIGSHFVNAAVGAGHTVVAHRRTAQSTTRVPLLQQPSWVQAPLHKVPLNSLSGCDAIVHLAAHTPNVPYDTLENCIYWNVTSPLELFRTAIQAGIDRFVVAGSCFEYGIAAERYEFIPADAPLFPTTSYSASKAAASIAFCQLAIEEQLRLSIHRIFHVYGEGESETRLWPSLRRAAIAGSDFPMTNGEQVRDFTHVETVAAYLLKCAVSLEICPGKPLITNIGSGTPTTVLEYAQEWWKTFGATGKLRIGDIAYRPNETMRYVPQLEPFRMNP